VRCNLWITLQRWTNKASSSTVCENNSKNIYFRWAAMHFYSLRCSCSALVLALMLSSCAYIIPEDPNQPRNNEVPGDRHKPQLNVMAPYAAPPAASAPPIMTTAPQAYAPMQAPALPPQAMLAAPVVNVPAVDEVRRMPAENAAFQVSAGGYPSITSVPPRPIMNGPDSAVERLRDTQSTLEYDRALANETRDRLAHDAAAEPSMLPPAPTSGVVAPADPVRVTPIAPTFAPAPQVQQYQPPSVDTAPAASRVYVPAPTAQILAPPTSQHYTPPAPLVVANTVPVVNGVQVRPGDFNPLATPESGALYYAPPQVSTTIHSARSSYGNGGFIAPSRYYTQRY
jgi:hypothetical protein